MFTGSQLRQPVVRTPASLSLPQGVAVGLERLAEENNLRQEKNKI